VVPIRTRTHIHRLLTPLLAAAAMVAVAAAPAAAADPDTEKPSAPANVIATWNGPVLALSWDPSTDNVGVTGYRISHQVLDMVFTNTSTTPGIVIKGLNRSWTYRFHLTAVDAAGNFSAGTSLTLTVPPGDTQPPTAPQELRGTVSARSALLQWRASTDNVYLDHYEVVRITDAGTTVVGRNNGAIGPAPTLATVGNLLPDTEYTLAVRAHDMAGNISELSAPIVLRTLTETPTCSVAYKVTAQWDTGFTGEVTVRNLSTVAATGWKLSWTYADGQRITSVWDAKLLNSPFPVVVVGAADYSTQLPAGGRATFGFLGSSTATNRVPTVFALDGKPCSIA
jgi:cellulose 1,4-beta-cellobiosidase